MPVSFSSWIKRRTNGKTLNVADSFNEDGTFNISIKGATKQLPDLVTGTLAVGASISEPTWQDAEGYRTVIITTTEASSKAISSWYVENQFTDVSESGRFNFSGASTVANTTQGTSTMDLRLRYFRNHVRNDDTVPRSFIVKRRLMMF